ncbi:uncharacterized protein PGTG_12897 [Puccinia graminis f. sp. tritici CRL 75-36-700-3]|uniref:Transposase IS30-like HTH domain-containing protein n=1 Tax=Puccinia graminis f. sp. tritici (strain CRL 75-36-700-3 / race SCCL) TaxID=418459 RepID=E3KSM7_PUCGT|nr:uncharacterized protein PGTG_12897 [Puccinia graminis f. sp. tritici CRL 75-36-700-3]EFP87313.1 hypothetical protein PGTG_12897 [Puccinia graminis f. sp. tritici CRL 75-36-700-3]
MAPGRAAPAPAKGAPLWKAWIVLMGRIRGQPNLTTEQKACIAGMVEAGMSHGRVARIVGSGQTTVSSIVSRARTCGTVETAEKSGLDRIAKYVRK